MSEPDGPICPDDSKTTYHLGMTTRAHTVLEREGLCAVARIRRIPWRMLRDLPGAGVMTAHAIRQEVPFKLLPGEKPAKRLEDGRWIFENEPKPRVRVQAICRETPPE